MDIPRFRKTVISLLALLCPALAAVAQPYQAVLFFRDKVGSPASLSSPLTFLSQRSLDRRAKFGIAVAQRDLPLSDGYVAQLDSAGIQVIKKSRWLNAVSVIGDSAAVLAAAQLPFVASEMQIARRYPSLYLEESCSDNTAAVTEDFGPGANQAHMLGIDSMHAAGYTGRGVLVAVMDAGYAGVDRHAAFRALQDSGRMADSYDYVYGNGASVYDYFWHGGGALSCIGGYYPGNFIGGAYQADYALYVTEDIRSELPIETFNWVVAAERADSLGADLISTSLGYFSFDKAWLSLTHDQLDGYTSLITQGVNIASQNGIVCVTSAGNEGQNSAWGGKISAPADATLGITVGAVFADSTIAPFSSRGFTNRPFNKPDVVAQGVNCIVYSNIDPLGVLSVSGTSFSCPLTSGLIAGMMQQYPNLTPAQWQTALHATGSRSGSPDTSYGYGLPNYGRLTRFINTFLSVKERGYAFGIYPNPQHSGQPLHFSLDTGSRIISIDIVDMLGKAIPLIETESWFPGMHAAHLPSLASGPYTIRIFTPGGVQRSRLIIQP